MKEKYLALLRGVNVSGKNPLKMNEFKLFLEGKKFENVKTYIQSGNIIFDYPKENSGKIAKHLKELIADKYSYDIPVIVIKMNQLKDIITNNPYPEYANNEPTKVLVSFFSNQPLEESVQRFNSKVYATEKYELNDTFLYLYCLNGYGKAKINNNFIEAKLKVDATTRNWKTILKLYELMRV